MTDSEKYNNLSSIDVYSLSPEELKIAIHEWAEGDETMEELLWKCYNSGVETKQSHAGARPYIEISADRSIDKVKNLISSVCNVDGFSTRIAPDGGNPFSGDVFYKPGLGLFFLRTENQEDADNIFRKMTQSLDMQYEPNKMIDSYINLYNAFKGKESNLDFRITFRDGKYQFSTCINGRYNLEQFNELFSKIGLTPGKFGVMDVWLFESDNIEDFGNKMEYFTNTLINNYSFELPDKLDERMSFNEKFLYIRRRFVERDGNDLAYKKFSNSFLEKYEQYKKDIAEGKISLEEAENWARDTFYNVEAEVIGPRGLN